MYQWSKHTSEKFSVFISKNISLRDKYNFYHYIGLMLDGGVSIEESLKSVSIKVSSQYFKIKIQELFIFISSWDSFSKAMKKMPHIFSLREVSMIEAWESSGDLAKSLQNLGDDLRYSDQLKWKVKNALTYPAIIFTFLLFAIFLVFIYVIPSIRPIFDDMWSELPWATIALLGVSDFIKENFLSLLFFIVFLSVLFIWYKNTKTGKSHIESFVFSLPIIGKIYRNYLIAHITKILSSLLNARVSILKIIFLTWRSTNTLTYELLFEQVALRIEKGMNLVDSIQDVDKNHEYFPLDVIQMLSVWEKTWALGNVSLKISESYEEQVDNSLWILSKTIEPLAIFIAGVFVLWFAFAIFGAILEITNIVG